MKETFIPPQGLTADEIGELVGAPETRLPDDVAAALPEGTPPPPWTVQMSSLFWGHASTAAALAALPPRLEPAGRRGVTTAGFLRYSDTPVGSYSEVMAIPTAVRGGAVHVPFIAVDSVTSVHAGRAHWALPKVLATFDWDGDLVRCEGDGWWLAAKVARWGPPVPLVGRGAVAQVRPDGRVGTSRLSTRGWGRLVSIEVDVDPAASYAAWLTPGRHFGIAVRSARMTMGAPRWGDTG